MTYPVPFQLRFRRVLAKAFFRGAYRVLFRVQFVGWENVPKSGAYVIAHNHVSIIEPPLVISHWPTGPEVIGAKELWKRSGQSWVVRLYGTIPVSRGSYERALLQQMIDILKAGTPLVMAPEGQRSHVPGLLRAQPGIGYLIGQTRVQVIPVAITGSTDENFRNAIRFKRPHLRMEVGKPFHLPPIEARGSPRREARQHHSDLVMEKIAEMLPEEYRGVYSEQENHGEETG